MMRPSSDWRRPVSRWSSSATGRSTSPDEERLDELNMQLLQRLNESGEVFLSHTRVGGTYALSLAIGNIRTTSRTSRGHGNLRLKAAQSLS
jgi:hypothetical protein